MECLFWSSQASEKVEGTGGASIAQGRVCSRDLQRGAWTVVLPCLLLTATLSAQPIPDLLASDPVRLQAWDPQTSGVNNTRFGEALAMDEDILVVGAHLEDSAVGFDTGAVYVYERVGVDWVERQKLRSPFQTPFEQFGIAVDVALGDAGEDYLIVGASGAGSGAAYLYKRTGGSGSWLQESTLDNLNPDNGDQFGRSVSIDYFLPPNNLDDLKVFVAAVGAPNDRDPVGTGSQNGSLSIFQRSGGPPTWGFTHEFFGENGDNLGRSVALSGPDIVAGIFGLEVDGLRAGGAQVFSQENFDGTVYVYAESWFPDPVRSRGRGRPGDGRGDRLSRAGWTWYCRPGCTARRHDGGQRWQGARLRLDARRSRNEPRRVGGRCSRPRCRELLVLRSPSLATSWLSAHQVPVSTVPCSSTSGARARPSGIP